MKDRPLYLTEQAIGRFLFDNPWCSAALIGRFLGLGRSSLGRLSDRVLFERLQIAEQGGRGYQTLYALTAEGSRRAVNAYRSPRVLAEALLLTYGRLERSREALSGLAGQEQLAWLLSPWRPSRRAPYFDALFVLKIRDRKAVLVGLASPPVPAKLDWYLDLIAAWHRWSRSERAAPAVLVLLEPSGDVPGQAVLHRKCPSDPRFPVCAAAPESLGNPSLWRALNEEPGAVLLPDHGRVPLEAATFRFDGRTTPYPKAATLRYWAGRDQSRPARTVRAFWERRPTRLELLLVLARFPALTTHDLALLSRRKKGHYWVGTRLSELEAAGLCGEGLPGRWLPSAAGLALLAGLAGVSPKAYNRYLGWPVRVGAFRKVEQHQDVVTGFMMRLLWEGALAHWSFNAARYTFTLPRPQDGAGLRQVRVYPDSAGVLDWEDGQGGLFWLEVDRGTRRGKRLSWKLEKYFLIHFSLAAPTHVPPILYLVSGPAGHEEKRLETVVRALSSLACTRPGTPLTLLLTTMSKVAAWRGPILDAPVWLRFAGDRLDERPVSLRALNKGGIWK